jgi:hypothetical protein
MSEASHAELTHANSELEVVITTGAEARNSADSLLASIKSDAVQNTQSVVVSPEVSNHLGESSKHGKDDSSKVEQIVLPNTFWSYDPQEFFNAIVAKLPALKFDFDPSNFIQFNLSARTFLETVDANNIVDVIASLGILQSANHFKFRLLENWLLSEIIDDVNIPENYRNYWREYRNSRTIAPPVAKQFISSPSSSNELPRNFSGGGAAVENSSPNCAKRLFDSTPEKMNLPGLSGAVNTPSFFRHIGHSTSALFSMLDSAPANLSPMVTTGEDGKFQIQFNMLPATPIVHPFPSLEILSKISVPLFLRKYKVSKMNAPIGQSKTLKSCINSLLWPKIAAKINTTGVDLMHFKEKTTDADIFATLLKKYGPKTADEAMAQLKEIVFKFDDSITPQDQFSGALIAHFNEVREQLTQFLYCSGLEELTSNAILLCIKDNFLHNPMIDGPTGAKVRQSSNNAIILERIQLLKHLPIHDMMSKIEEMFEEDDGASSLRKGFKVVPWRNQSSDKVQGGIKKASQNNQNNRNQHNRNQNNYQRSQNNPPKQLCCKCGRPHEATVEACVLFDHPSAGKADTWPADTKALIIEDKKEWADWLEKKHKTHPDLVDKIRRINVQGNHRGGGGKPPRYPTSQNNNNHRNSGGKFVKRTNCAASSLNIEYLRGGGVHESDGSNTGDAAHVTHADDDGVELASEAGARVEEPSNDPHIDELIMPVFQAVGRFKRGKTDKGKNYPSNRRLRTLKVLMDPGSESNFISERILKSSNILIIKESEAHRIQILQNEAPMSGESNGECKRAVRVRFSLDLLRKAEIKHEEWFVVSPDVKFDAVLGRKFCKEAGLTAFDTILSPWSRAVQIDGNGTESEDDETKPEEKAPENKAGRNRHQLDSDNPEFSDEEAAAKQLEFDAAVAKVPAELIDKFATKHPVTGRPILRNPNIAGPALVEHVGTHVSRDNLKIMENECAKVVAINSMKQRCKIVRMMSVSASASESQKSAEEVEKEVKTRQQMADDAAKFYRENEHLLCSTGTFVPSKKHARFFEPVSFNATTFGLPAVQQHKPAEASSPPSRQFENNQMVLLKGLVTHAELNGLPARVMSFDEEKKKYVISVSRPRGYWLCNEEYLRPIDSVKKTGQQDWGPQEFGIDPESGQPTLEPLQRPAHRQYGAQYSPGLTARINELLIEFAVIFSTDVTKPCGFKPMKIKLKPNAVLPRNPRLWKNSPLIRAEIRRQLQKMIDMKIVSKSSSAIVSNVLMVKRPGMPGKFRFTVDFRAINEATESQTWQMPDVQDQLSRLKGNKIFGCADATAYYHQIMLDKDSRYLTAFVTEDGVFEYERVPMGAKNACAHAQSELQMALDADPILRKHGIRNYFDDIPFGAKTEDDYIENSSRYVRIGTSTRIKI